MLDWIHFHEKISLGGQPSWGTGNNFRRRVRIFGHKHGIHTEGAGVSILPLYLSGYGPGVYSLSMYVAV